jgi:hypothetical protein
MDKNPVNLKIQGFNVLTKTGEARVLEVRESTILVIYPNGDQRVLTRGEVFVLMASRPSPYNYKHDDSKPCPFTILERIVYSGIPKDVLKHNLNYIVEEKVPNREGLEGISDEALADLWFKNWLHPNLKKFYRQSPNDKRGCTIAVLERDNARDFTNFYENGQQNFNYTLDDIRAYCDSDDDLSINQQLIAKQKRD